MTDRSQMRHNIKKAMLGDAAAQNTEEARAHLAIHSVAAEFGWRAAHYLQQQLGKEILVNRVLAQREERIKSGTLHTTNAEGQRVEAGGLNLLMLGLGEDQIRQVSQLKAQEDKELQDIVAKSPGDKYRGADAADAADAPERPTARGVTPSSLAQATSITTAGIVETQTRAVRRQ